MFVSALGSLCALAATANAFLVTPSMEAKGGLGIKRLPFPSIIDPKSYTMKLACPTCPSLKDETAGESALVLNFDVDGETRESLSVNGIPLFPPRPLHSGMSATQIPSGMSLIEANTESVSGSVQSRQLSYEALIRTEKNLQRSEILSMEFKVLAVDNKAVSDLDIVEVHFISLAHGEHLQILHVTHKPSGAQTPATPGEAGGAKGCKTYPLLCKWKALVASKMANMRNKLPGCHKARPTVHIPTTHTPPHSHEHSHSRPRPHHRQRITLLRVMKRIAFQVIVPIFVGIVAGMTASLVGMIVGHLIVLAWRKFYRGDTRGTYVVLEHPHEARDGDEKDGLLSDDDLPEYTEAAVGIVTDEKKDQEA
ncbi:MAG: hypothetical protein M1833_001627 [Piccolia ochrophora]|nr:MAG: hypothetical protein M1833_001627 [Piccolia ochrophora]